MAKLIHSKKKKLQKTQLNIQNLQNELHQAVKQKKSNIWPTILESELIGTTTALPYRGGNLRSGAAADGAAMV